MEVLPVRATVILAAISAACCLAVVPVGAARAGTLPEPVADCPPTHGIAAPSSTPWAQRALSFSSVWGLTRGAGVTVAVLDSGVDANPQFGNRVIVGPDLAGENVGVPADADCVGHGTSVASIIAAAPQAGISFSGVAPAATILSVKITNSDEFHGSLMPTAILDAVAGGAGVINLSLATTNTPALQAAVDFALAHNVVVVAAAGNDEPDSGVGPFYPAAYPGVLSVGAVAEDGSLASFSDTHTPVTVTAPGVNVTSAYPGTFPDAYNPGDDGTSFATAFVSGVAALVRSRFPSLSAAQVVARIETTADGAAGPGTGNGMVNPVQAVTAVLPAGGGPAATGTAAHASIPRPVPPDRLARTVALSVMGGALGLAALVIIAAVVIPAGRRRRWRPGGAPADRLPAFGARPSSRRGASLPGAGIYVITSPDAIDETQAPRTRHPSPYLRATASWTKRT
jgi:membrane-anchored mycosin MYCP